MELYPIIGYTNIALPNGSAFIMDNLQVKLFINEEFKKILEPCKNDYHKLMERILQFRFNLLDFLSEKN